LTPLVLLWWCCGDTAGAAVGCCGDTVGAAVVTPLVLNGDDVVVLW